MLVALENYFSLSLGKEGVRNKDVAMSKKYYSCEVHCRNKDWCGGEIGGSSLKLSDICVSDKISPTYSINLMYLGYD
jgi:hypothetical protein